MGKLIYMAAKVKKALFAKVNFKKIWNIFYKEQSISHYTLEIKKN